MEAHDAAFDRIMKIVGDDGKFQNIFNYTFNIGLLIFGALSYMNIILALSIPEHWCNVPGREIGNYSIEKWKNLTLPVVTGNTGTLTFSSCSMYNVTHDHLLRNADEWKFKEKDIIKCTHGWIYDKTWYEVTAASAVNWVCDRELYVTNTFVFNRIGEVIGTVVFGHLGDTIGRRFVYYVSIISVIVGRIFAIIGSNSYILFAIGGVIASFSSTFIFQSPLIISIECSKKEDRAHLSMIQSIGWAVGMCIMPLIFWWVRDWITFILLTTLPGIVFFFFAYYMIESPRWLANRGKLSECLYQLKKIAKINGREFTLTEKSLEEALGGERKPEKVYGFMSLFSSWRLTKNTVLMIITWIASVLLYFILVLNASKMDGNPFLNFLSQSAIELPANLIGRLSGNTIGRRFTVTISFLVSTIANILQIFIVTHKSNELISSILAIIIRFCLTITFFGVNLIAIETYPTCLRQTGISFGTVIANAVGIFGPYVVFLGTNFDVRYPYIIMGALSLAATLSALFFPETLNQKLPETLEEAQIFGSEQKFWSLNKPTLDNDKEKSCSKW